MTAFSVGYGTGVSIGCGPGGGPGGGGSPGEALLAEARLFIDWGAAADNDFAVAPNVNDATVPGRNIIPFNTGLIFNESAGVAPTRTPFYGSVTDPSGVTNNALRIVTTGTNQTLNFYRTATCEAIPSGVYGLRGRMRANAGTGPWAISVGLSTGLVSDSAIDLDWSNPANDADTTFEAEFTYAGTGDIYLRVAASGADILVDRLQLYAGGLASIPDWADEVRVGGRKAFATANMIDLDGDGNWLLGAGEGGAIIYEPGMVDKAYTAITQIHVGSFATADVAALGYAQTVPVDTRLGTTLTSMHLAYEATGVYSGEPSTKPGSTSRANTGINVLAKGVQFIGQTLSATKQRRYFDAIPVTDETVVFSGVSAAYWRVGAANTNNRAQHDTQRVFGAHAADLIWDRELSITEYGQVITALKARFAARGLGAFTDFHVISGDSNATRATGDWTQLVTADGYMSPGENLWMSDTSVGGQGLDELEGVSGRFALRDGPMLLAAANQGVYALYHMCIGTNDWPDIDDDYTAYLARWVAMVENALALNPLVHVLCYTVIPRGVVTPPTYEAERLLFNDALRAYIAATDRVWLCEFGDNATIGDKAAQSGGGGTYYLSDETHFTPAGDAAAAAIAKTAVNDWRTAVGL